MNESTGGRVAPEVAAAVPVRVWDLPTRLFHWTLALCIVGSVISGKVGGNALTWHFRLGYVVFALLAFRLVWGFVGGRWSRFGSFVRGPGTVLRYLRGEHRAGDHFEVGHNPLGMLSVLALIGLLALQVASGLVADDEIANTGPLNRFVSGAVATAATSWHKTVGQYGLIALVVLHIGAIVFYLRRKRIDLVRPMLHGDKVLPPHTPPSRDDGVTRAAAAALILGCAALVTAIVKLGG
jgi:cytochrome b